METASRSEQFVFAALSSSVRTFGVIVAALALAGTRQAVATMAAIGAHSRGFLTRSMASPLLSLALLGRGRPFLGLLAVLLGRRRRHSRGRLRRWRWELIG